MNPASFVKKSNSTLRINGKQVREATTMFPKNWNDERIMEEVAVAWKNMEVSWSKIEEGKKVDCFIGKATTGMEIELIFNDGVLITATPKITLK